MSAPMSVFVPYIDATYSFDTIRRQFEEVFEIGKVDRIESVPRINSDTGGGYNICFIYFSTWGNGYNAQFLRNQLMEGKQTKMYYLIDRYWKVCPNTSPVADLPNPVHYDLVLYVPKYYYQAVLQAPVTHDHFFSETIDAMELGLVEPGAWAPETSRVYDQEMVELLGENHREEYQPIVVTMKYWYHSKNAFDIQKILEEEKNMVVYPNIDTFPYMAWLFIKHRQPPLTNGVNPYIWYADQTQHPTQNKHTRFNDTH